MIQTASCWSVPTRPLTIPRLSTAITSCSCAEVQTDKQPHAEAGVPLLQWDSKTIRLAHDAIHGLHERTSAGRSGRRPAPNRILDSGTSRAPTRASISPFYPYFVVGDPSQPGTCSWASINRRTGPTFCQPRWSTALGILRFVGPAE